MADPVRRYDGCSFFRPGVGLFCSAAVSDDTYVAVGIIALVSVGIAAGVFVHVKIAFDRITEKCDDRWQYYKNTGVAELRKAVSVALCVVSVTLSMLSVSLIPVDINVLSWWLILSAGLNFLYHGSCKGSYH